MSNVQPLDLSVALEIWMRKLIREELQTLKDEILSEISDKSAMPPSQPKAEFMRARDVVRRCGMSRSTIWRRTRDTTNPFPKPCNEGWRTVEVESWLDRTQQEKKIVTYFIQSELGGSIKIGKTANVTGRLAQLQTGRADQLVVRRLVKGDHESKFHRKFAHLREHGEWFACERELQQFLFRPKLR